MASLLQAARQPSTAQSLRTQSFSHQSQLGRGLVRTLNWHRRVERFSFKRHVDAAVVETAEPKPHESSAMQDVATSKPTKKSKKALTDSKLSQQTGDSAAPVVDSPQQQEQHESKLGGDGSEAQDEYISPSSPQVPPVAQTARDASKDNTPNEKPQQTSSTGVAPGAGTNSTGTAGAEQREAQHSMALNGSTDGAVHSASSTEQEAPPLAASAEADTPITPPSQLAPEAQPTTTSQVISAVTEATPPPSSSSSPPSDPFPSSTSTVNATTTNTTSDSTALGVEAEILGKQETAQQGQQGQPPTGRSLQAKRAQRRARQRQRRRLEKQQAAAAAATAAVTVVGGVAAAAAAVPAAEAASGQEGSEGILLKEEEAAQGDEEGGKGEVAPRSRGAGTRPLISPKEEDLMRWSEDAVHAAEREYALVSRASTQQAGGYFAAVAKALQDPLGERLGYMGFEALPFPSFTPLTHRHLQQQQQDDDEEEVKQQADLPPAPAAPAGDKASSSGPSVAQQDPLQALVTLGGELPVLASQWHLEGSTWGSSVGGAGSTLWDVRSMGSVLQESHAVHAEEGMAAEHAQAMIGLYEEFVRDVAGVPAVAGRQPGSQRLRGAAASYTLVAMAGEGRAVQIASSHNLADNYSRGFLESDSLPDAEDPDSDSVHRPSLYQMAAGVQSPLLGSMGLTLGDDRGLLLPPLLAPTQVVIVPVFRRYRCNPRQLIEEGERLKGVLEAAGVRAAVDARRKGPGPRFGAAERMGVPLRIEIGPRDLSARSCVITRRDTPGPEGRVGDVSLEGDALAYAVQDLLDDMQSDLRWGAASILGANIADVTSYYELKDVIEAGKWARGPWAGSYEDEMAIQEETGASLLCIPLQQPTSMWSGFNTCLYSGYQASEVAVFARPL